MNREQPFLVSTGKNVEMSPVLFNISAGDTDESDDALAEKDRKPKKETAFDQEMRVRCEVFQKRYEEQINAYFGTPDVSFTLKPGEGAYIDLEKISVNIDPKLLFEYGLSDAETLFVNFHEAEHFRDMLENPDAYERNFERIKQTTETHSAFPKALHRLFNCVDDILVNKQVMRRFHAGTGVKNALYPKLFASADLSKNSTGAPTPRHQQFMYALLRQAMLPDEAVTIDPEVAEAIEKVQKSIGGKTDLIDFITDREAMEGTLVRVNDGRKKEGKESIDTVQFRFFQMWQQAVPVFEELYKKDLADRKAPPRSGGSEKSGGQGEPGGEKSQPGEGDPFVNDPFEGAIPDPISQENAIPGAGALNRQIAAKKKQALEDMLGVKKEDLDAYKRDFQSVETYIDRLSKVFDRVIERRKTVRRVLRKSVKEGVMLDPRKAAVALAEIKAGHDDPQVMLDYEKRESMQNLPSEFEFTLVCDGSGSMRGNEKEVLQRKLAVLVAEALTEFQMRLEKERRRGEDIQLNIKTEVRMFATDDYEVKRMGDTLTHPDRVKMHKVLRQLPGGGNNEPATFEAIEKEQFHPKVEQKLREGEMKKVILFLTDGESDGVAIKRCRERLEDRVGEKKSGEGNGLVIVGIGFGEGRSVIETYKPNGYYAESLEHVLEIFEKFLEEIIDTL
ncbi:MAG: VWA domain-containing protein [Candidatus Moraniibacteriota bacterium]|jgi:hypothetical protein|nr:MAG: VWA domain-containing protein [Candidatus Moranbacteria bacterium]